MQPVSGETAPAQRPTRREALLVALAFAVGPWLVTPVVLHGANAINFAIGLKQAAPTLLLGGALFFALAYGLLRWSRTGTERLLVMVLAVAFLFWIQGHLVVWDYGVLDGRPIDWRGQWQRGLVDLGLWVGMLGAAFWLAPRLRPGVALVATALLSIYAVTTVTSFLGREEPPSFHRYTLDRTHQFDFSKQENVILLVLDAFQSDVFEEVLEQRPEFRDRLDGFTYYRNAAAGFAKTHPSVPLMFTGQWFDNSVPIADFIETSFEEHSVTVPMIEAGWRVDLFPWVERVVHHSTDVASNVRPNDDPIVVAEASGRLMDLSLFRLSPHVLKSFWLNDSQWRLARLWRDFAADARGEAPAAALHPNPDAAWLLGLEQRGRAHWDQPAFKFYHLMVPHEPFLLREDLSIERFPPGREGFLGQSITTVSMIDRMLRKLDALGVYDDSTLVILADHGGGDYDAGVRAGPVVGEATGTSAMPGQHHASALPLVLVKPRGARGRLQTSDAPVSTGDVAPALARVFAGEAPRFARSEAPGGEGALVDAPRRYYFYRHQGWQGTFLPPMTEYELTGHSWDAASWAPTGRVLLAGGEVLSSNAYTLGERATFDGQGATSTWLVDGWSGEDSLGSWSNAAQARLRVPLDPDAAAGWRGPVFAHFELEPFSAEGAIDHQPVALSLAGEPLADLDVDATGCYSVRLFDALPAQTDMLEFGFEFPAAASPADFGISLDYRLLGVRLRSLELGPARFLPTDEPLKLHEGDLACAARYRGWNNDGWALASTRSSADLILRMAPEAIAGATALVLEMGFQPFLGNGALDEQRLTLSTGGRGLGQWTFSESQAITVPLEAGDFQNGRLTLRFELPDATAPSALGINADRRALGLYLRELTLKTGR